MMRRMRSVAASGASVNPPARRPFNFSIKSTETDSMRSEGSEMVRCRPANCSAQSCDQLDHIRVIGGGERQQRQLLDAGAGDGLFGCLEDLVHTALPDGAGDHAGLAEPAAARAAAHHFQCDAVVHHINVRDDEVRGWRRKLGHHALEHRLAALLECWALLLPECHPS